MSNVLEAKKLNRESWRMESGEEVYPSDFEDGGLISTIELIHNNARRLRLENARILCNDIHKYGHDNVPLEDFYNHFHREMNKFIDRDISDISWLKENYKLYNLLVEESNHRGINIVETKNEKETTKRSRGIMRQLLNGNDSRGRVPKTVVMDSFPSDVRTVRSVTPAYYSSHIEEEPSCPTR